MTWRTANCERRKDNAALANIPKVEDGRLFTDSSYAVA